MGIAILEPQMARMSHENNGLLTGKPRKSKSKNQRLRNLFNKI